MTSYIVDPCPASPVSSTQNKTSSATHAQLDKQASNYRSDLQGQQEQLDTSDTQNANSAFPASVQKAPKSRSNLQGKIKRSKSNMNLKSNTDDGTYFYTDIESKPIQ